MATFNFSYNASNLTGHTNWKVLYRQTGSIPWTSFTTSGTTVAIGPVLNNTIYDIEVQNINGFDNAVSTIAQAIGFTNPNPTISTTNTTVAYSFANLSSFITSYTTTIALAATPGTIISTNVQSPVATVSGTFTGLTPLTSYVVTITPVASEFSFPFTYPALTAESALCAAPTSSYAYLTSGATSILNISWSNIAIAPGCGYNVSYRSKGATAYSTFVTSGTTSGTTSVSTVVRPYACYEGFIQSNCCSGIISPILPFGANAYDFLNANASASGNGTVVMNLTSLYPNPYATLITGSVVLTDSPTPLAFSLTYPANTTNSPQIIATGRTPFATQVSINITAVVPAFDNGGAIQQFDSLLTPNYFQFVTSGSAWNGSPAILPSFTLDRFTITETDVVGNVLKGALNFSWIYDHMYGGGISPYDTVTFKVYDSLSNGATPLGSVTVSTSTLGLQNSTIYITAGAQPITSSLLLYMKPSWSNTVVIDTVQFYLPLF